MNALLEERLRHYVSVNHRDLMHHLDATQFFYNLWRHESTSCSPSELAIGRQLLAPHTAAAGEQSHSPVALQFTSNLQEKDEIAKANLEKVARGMKKWADEKRQLREFAEGIA